MARPPKRGLFYFPLDLEITRDFKILELQESYGPLGFQVYLFALQFVYRNGYYVSCTVENMARQILKEIGEKYITKAEIIEILEFCGAIGLFCEKFMKEGVFTSKGIQRRFLDIKKRNKINKANYWLLGDDDDFAS